MGDLSSREGSLSFRAEGVARVGKPSYHGLREGWEGVGKKGKQGQSGLLLNMVTREPNNQASGCPDPFLWQFLMASLFPS